MHKNKKFFAVVILAAASIAGATPGDSLGDEFLVNDESSGFQGNPALAMKRTGDFLVVWNGAGGSVDGVWAQSHWSSGEARAEAFRIDEPGSGSASDAAVGMSRYGAFLAAWVSDAGDYDIQARLFSPADESYSGGAQFTVNTTTPGDQGWPGYPPAVATDVYGGVYVVVWGAAEPGGYGVYGRRFNSLGEPDGDEFRINTLPSAGPPTVSVDMADSGAFVVVWDGKTLGSTVNDIVARRYDAVGAALGPEFKVNASAPSPRGSPAVAVARSGSGFAVVWQGSGTDPDEGEIYVRRYDADGVALGDEFQVNTTPAGYQRHPKAATDHDGDLIVAWESLDQDGSDFGVYGRRFLADGTPAGTEFQVNQHVAGAQLLGAVGMDGDGDILATWASENQDGDSYGVYARRYRGPEDIDLSIDLSDAEDPAHTGGWLIYDLTVSNNNPYVPAEGGDWASGVRVDVQLAPGQSLDTFDGGWDWTCTGTTLVSCSQHGGIWPEGSGSLRLYTLAPAAAGTWTATATVSGHQDDGNAANNSDTEATTVADLEPDALTFDALTGVQPSSVQTSNEVTITGIETPVPVRVSSGSYSLNGQPFTTADGVASNGDTLRLQHVASPYWNGTRQTLVTVGAGAGTFSSTTRSADTTPDAFAFVDQYGVPRNTLVTSGAITPSGFDGSVSIGVSGGSYSIAGGAFTTSAGTVVAGQQVRVRHTSASTFSTPVDTVLTIGGVSDTFSSVTLTSDTTPDPFSFGSRSPVERSSLQTAGPVFVNGINDAAPISAVGGSYSLNGGPYTTAPGTVTEGETVRVQHVASDQFSTTVETTLTIGGYSTVFATTTEAQDLVPNAFSFPSQSGVVRDTTVTSAEITIGGINDAAPVTIGGGAYSIDGAAFTSAPGSIANGQRVRVQHTSAAGFAIATTTTLTLGGVSGTFTSFTESEDTTPAPFSFTDQTGVPTGTAITSDNVTIGGINSLAPVSVTGGSYSINGGSFVTSGGTAQGGDQLRVRHVSSSSGGGTVLTTLTVGGVSDTFSSTAGTTDTTPSAFAFTDVTGARTNARVVSDTITVGGINTAVSLTVSGGDAQYSKNGGKYTSAPSTVFSGDTVKVRVTSAAAALTTVNVTVTIGAVSDVWSVTTR